LHLASKKQLIEDEVRLLEVEYYVKLTDVAIVFIHLFNVTVDDLEGDQLVVGGVAASDEKQGGIASIDNLAVYWGRAVRTGSTSEQKMQRNGHCKDKESEHYAPLYSRKLHIRVRLDRTSCVTSLTIFAFSLGERVVNHFASL
jgi:hypothetical protein